MNNLKLLADKINSVVNQLSINTMIKKKILVVDDSEKMRGLIRSILERDSRFEIEEAVNGREAFNLIKTESFDLLITDLFMPEMNERELITKLREENFKIPIIVISGLLYEVLKKQLTENGALCAIDKPFEADHLLKTVRDMVK
jgi:two-component system chemotaxis response regulator CheY